MNDLCIYGALVADSAIIANIGMKDGLITEIGENVAAREEINAEGMIALPGMIDTHVHIRGGSFSHREDFSSGRAAAAAGGVTTILEMPIAKPPASTPEVFVKRKEEASHFQGVDIKFYGGAGIDNLHLIHSLSDLGAVAFKTFLMPPPKGREEEFFGLCSVDDESLISVMEAVKQTGLPLAVHAEDNPTITEATRRVQEAGGKDLKAFEESRPEIAEIRAVERVIRAAERTGCKTIICHVSTRASLELIGQSKKRGCRIYAESCPHYLTMDYNNKGHVFARVKPPLRSPDSRQNLVSSLSDGMIDFVGSDHAPYLPDEKLKGGDIWNTVDGMPSLELSMPLMLNFVDKFLCYQNLAQITSTNAARAFGLEDRGVVEVGKRADLVLVKPVLREFSRSEMYTKSSGSAGAFDGTFFNHRVEMTISKGKLVYNNIKK